MKKSLFALPLLAALLLVGCGKEESTAHKHVPGTKWYSDETYHWHKCVADGCNQKTKHLEEAEHTFVEDETLRMEPTVDEEGYACYECSVCGYVYEETLPQLVDKRGPETVGDYKRVDSLEEGKKYAFGYYDSNKKKLCLANGEYHSDAKGYYPYYMATVSTTAKTTEAASFEIEYINSEEFTIKVTCSDDTSKPWHNKYMSVYSATSSYDNAVFSIAPVDDINDQYQPLKLDLKPDTGKSPVNVNGKFKFYESTDFACLNAPGISVQHEVEDEARLRVFGCTFGKYVSVDCSVIDNAVANEYSVAHFYEVISE